MYTSIIASGWKTIHTRAERRLRVAHLDVAPDEKEEELAYRHSSGDGWDAPWRAWSRTALPRVGGAATAAATDDPT